MKSEKLIAGIIITVIGLFIAYLGYQNMLPDKIEQGMNMLNDLSNSLGGEAIPVKYEKDKTGAVLTLIGGGALTFLGIWFILKSRE